MARDELLAWLAGVRQARVGQVRVPHKPLLLLWLFGHFAATGSSAASYQQAEEPVNQLINDFGRPWPGPPRPGSGPRCPSSTWNASYGTCGTPSETKSARTPPNVIPGCWTAER